MRYYKLCIPHYSGMPITKIHRTIREGCRRGDIRGGVRYVHDGTRYGGTGEG